MIRNHFKSEYFYRDNRTWDIFYYAVISAFPTNFYESGGLFIQEVIGKYM